MSAREELLAALAYIRIRTGDPNAWQLGLTPQEVTAVVNPATRSEQLEAILGKIRQHHHDVLGPSTPFAAPPADAPGPERERGATADAIAHAEAALAQQNTASARLDMQVISAILNAHLKSVEGGQSLTTLQREIEAAVQARSDFDTPAGARDFQRLLIGKLRDIRAILLDANLDDASKSAMMAAWTSLYDASKGDAPGERDPASTVPAGVATGDDEPDTDWDDALLDAIPSEDPGPQGAPAAPMPTIPAAQMPSFPGFGTGSMPGFGTGPGSMGGFGLPLPGLQDGARAEPALRKLDDEGLATSDELDGGSAAERDGDHPEGAPAANPESPDAVPTTVTLPDGETLTAASPELAAAIQASVGGVPIADAFRQQGLTIPPPGSPVAEPLDPLRLAPGDIGIFTDRHALALSPGKALVDGQIQHIATVSGPSFLGWNIRLARWHARRRRLSPKHRCPPGRRMRRPPHKRNPPARPVGHDRRQQIADSIHVVPTRLRGAMRITGRRPTTCAPSHRGMRPSRRAWIRRAGLR